MKDYYVILKKLFPRKIRILFKPWYLKWKLRNFNQPQSVVVKRYGFSIKLDPQNRAVDEYIFVHKNWETGIGNIIERELRKGSTFIDVGANIGYFSLLAAGVVGKAGRVIAFEPIARVAQQLSESVKENNFNTITVKQLAVGNNPGTFQMSIMPGNIGGSSLVKNIPSGFYETVTVSTLDHELKNINRVDLMKIDVEGYEYEVLQGAQEILTKFKPKIILELSPSVYEKRDATITRSILNLLITLGYRAVDIDYGYDTTDIDRYLEKLGRKQTNLLLTIT